MSKRLLIYELLLTALVLGCGGGSDAPTAPSGGGGNGGGGGGGEVSGGGGGGPIATAVTVTTGNIFFRSDRNGSVNQAVDTVAVGGTVTWKWTNTGLEPHNIQSLGMPGFASSQVETGDGSSYQVTLSTPGTYRYNCAIHGNLMTGVIVVRGS